MTPLPFSEDSPVLLKGVEQIVDPKPEEMCDSLSEIFKVWLFWCCYFVIITRNREIEKNMKLRKLLVFAFWPFYHSSHQGVNEKDPDVGRESFRE